MEYTRTYKSACNWIINNNIDCKGIALTSNQRIIYPEVSGYYIQTLLENGQKELAISFARYLCSIQKEDGSWYDAYDNNPYIFDTAQILKGLISIESILPEVDKNIKKGVGWILSCMDDEGRLLTPSKDAWGTNENVCSELIHIYCIKPIKDAGLLFNDDLYLKASEKMLHFYKTTYYEKIINFSLLSHFYGYVMEALYDLGEIEMCRTAMNNLNKYSIFGIIPGMNNVTWVCSTGLFQLALVWYKLGCLKKGDKLFNYACKLQNESGGWFGSYPLLRKLKFLTRWKNNPWYFPNEEISWAVKYYLDAYSYRNKLINKS